MCGHDHESFWDQTPRTLLLTFEAHNDSYIKEHNEWAWIAWHIASMQRAKKIPPLSKLQIRKTMVPKTMEEQIEGLKNWVIASGGTVIYKQ